MTFPASTYASLLPDRAILAVGGEDAKPFLQGLVTNDIRKLTPDAPIYTWLLSPQGKYLHDFIVTERIDGELWLDTAASRIEELTTRLTRYKLRAKVSIAPRPDLAAGVAWPDNPAIHNAVFYRDPRHERLGMRFIFSKEEAPSFALNATPEEYDSHRLSLAIPNGEDMIAERSFAAEFGLEYLHGLDFAKGCYVGQEVTARSKYRGVLRKCLHRVEGVDSSPLPPPGTPILTETGEIAGEMRTYSQGAGLAILRLPENKTTGERVFLTDGMRLRASLPAWFPAPVAEAV